MISDPPEPEGPRDSFDESAGNPLLTFLQELVEYRGLIVTRFTAMEFEQECGSSEFAIVSAMSGPTYVPPPHQELPYLGHPFAMAMLRHRYYGDYYQPNLDLDVPPYPLRSTASREAPF